MIGQESSSKDPIEKKTDFTLEEVVSMATTGFENLGIVGVCKTFKINAPYNGVKALGQPDLSYFPDEEIEGMKISEAHSIYSVVEFQGEDKNFLLKHMRFNSAYFPTEMKTRLNIEMSRIPEFRGDFRSVLDKMKPVPAETITINHLGRLLTYAKYTNGAVKLHGSKIYNEDSKLSQDALRDPILTLAQFDAIAGEIMKVVYSGK